METRNVIIGILAFIIAFIIGFTIMSIKYHRYRMLLQVVLCAVTSAEEMWGSKTGKIKFAEVYDIICTRFPILALWLGPAAITEIIENALKEMKRILQNKLETEAASE